MSNQVIHKFSPSEVNSIDGETEPTRKTYLRLCRYRWDWPSLVSSSVGLAVAGLPRLCRRSVERREGLRKERKGKWEGGVAVWFGNLRKGIGTIRFLDG